MDNKRAMHLLTQAQVYMPSVVPGRAVGGWLVFSATREIGRGATIDEAMAAAAAAGNIPDLPPRPLFIASQYSVTRLGTVVATTSSRTMAQRIANALNFYNPNERGI
jgi:hypothetical protein